LIPCALGTGLFIRNKRIQKAERKPLKTRKEIVAEFEIEREPILRGNLLNY